MHFFLADGLFIFGDCAVFGFFLKQIDGVPADVANGDSTVFRHSADDFGELDAAFFAQFRKNDSQKFFIYHRVQAKVGFLNRLVNAGDYADVPRLNAQGSWRGGGDAGKVPDSHLRAVGVYQNVFNESGRSLPRSNSGKFFDNDLFAFLHFLFCIEQNIIHRHKRDKDGFKVCCLIYEVTKVPTFWPAITFFRLCGLKISKTIMGISLSMHKENAVESMILSRFCRASE